MVAKTVYKNRVSLKHKTKLAHSVTAMIIKVDYIANNIIIHVASGNYAHNSMVGLLFQMDKQLETTRHVE